MVHVAPPPGWTPVAAPVLEPHPSGPPPLDRVAAAPSTLDLGPTGTTRFGAIFRHPWLAGGGALSVVLVVVGVMCWLLMRPAEPEPIAVATDRPATVAKKTETDRAPSPGLQSRGVSTPATPATPPPKSPTTPKASTTPPTTPPTSSPPTAPPTGPPKAPPEVKPPKADPPPPVAKETAKDPVKEEKEEVKQEAKQPETKKAPPVQVDVAARMADLLPGIELTDLPLVRAVDLLAAVSTLPITLDPDAMRQLGVAPRDRISLRLDSTTTGKALQAVAAQRGLAVTVDNGQVILTVPAERRETLRTVPYTVSDLTGDDKAAVAEFAALVRKLVAPESWRDAGGRGTIEPKERVVVVTQARDVHQQVLVFCERLRNARKKPLRSHDRPEQFTLTTRTSQARQMLDQPVTVNYHEPAPLGKILGFLATATGSDILIDHAALAAAETSDRVETSLTVQQQPLGAVLADVLRPLGLTYRAIGANAIQVTSSEAAEERLELEFYPVGPRLKEANSAAKLAERLKTEVAASTWSDAGGPGEVYFDASSQCLIVLQSQRVQAAIERLLAAKGDGGGGKGK